MLMNIKNVAKDEIETFLIRLKAILKDSKFDIDSQFILCSSRKDISKLRYTTKYTVKDMGNLDCEDIAEILLELKVEDYSETLLDKKNLKPPKLYVFGKYIDNKLIYIKLKIREKKDKSIVVCVSFHYAERDMQFPFAN